MITWTRIAVRCNPVNLDRDSLYLVTRYAASPFGPSDVFNWSLYHVDSSGAITTHEWREMTLALGRTETYVCNEIKHTSTSTRRDTTIGYFKLNGYAAPSGLALTEFKQMCDGIFKPTYLTKEANRRHGVSSDAWLEGVLDELKKRRRLVGSPSDIIATAIQISGGKTAQYLQCYTTDATFSPAQDVL